MSNPTPTHLEPDRFAYSALLDAMPDAVVMVDHDGHIVEFNARAQGMFGYTREEVLGESVEVLIPERFRDGHAGQRDRYAKAPFVRPMGAGVELFALRKTGIQFPVEINLAPFQSPRGPLVVTVIRDVSDRKSHSG
ncbi:MAG: PAS domain S-box protein [Gemmatimonadota bacterium]|nr:PAS domain S-box protein [Gemmatimonadota bacterium]MDH3478216.1 PAS domain S-box protein [Gemmatimonadota bacterium]MDH3568679.1 PAS domain S-box protein [Gemmatimonadota bacterium]MDH5549013.1 PAS domain S-box protein [Gemmatimonadota bacterium]